MRAVVFSGGGPDQLEMTELPDPEAGPGEVLVRVRACAMNHLDVWATGPSRAGVSSAAAVSQAGPRILGADISGEVVDTGPGVSGFTADDRVLSYPAVPCERCQECQYGRHGRCPDLTIIGSPARPGGYGELVALPASNLFTVPDNLSFEEAASIPVVFMTAWEMLITKGHLQTGEWVLVNAAGSGVGVAAIQLAKLLGAKVVTNASTQEKRRMGLELGADAAVDYTKEGWGEEVRRIADDEGVHLVADNVGGDVLVESWNALRPGGKLVTCGLTAGRQVTLELPLRKQTSLELSFLGSRAHLGELLPYFRSGQLRAVLHSVLPFERVKEGHEAMINRGNFGKIVLTW